MRAWVGGGARNTARMSASPDLRRRRTPSATVVLGLGPPSGGGGGGAGSGGGSSRGGGCGDARLDGEDEAMKYSGGECRWKTNENTKAAANSGEKLASAARTRGIGTHLRVGERQTKREETRRGGGAHVVGRDLIWEASAEAWWWTAQAATPRAKAPVQETSAAGWSAGSDFRPVREEAPRNSGNNQNAAGTNV